MRSIIRNILIIVFLLASQAKAGITVKYFSTSSAGSGDGSSWANRAAGISSGAISTVITGFNFSGSDSLIAYYGPGTYTLTSTLASGSFANPPTANNSLYIQGCDSSGNALTPANTGWTSDMPGWNDSGLPIFATTTNIATSSLATVGWRLVKFTASGAQTTMLTGGFIYEWCSFVDSTSHASAVIHGQSGTLRAFHCMYSMTGSIYASAVLLSGDDSIENCKLEGVTGSSGARRGINYTGSRLAHIIRCNLFGFPVAAIESTSSSTTAALRITNCTIDGSGGDGIKLNNTSNQTAWSIAENNYIVNCNTGIYANTAGHAHISNNRMRDNTSNTLFLGNYQEYDTYGTDSDDASELNNKAGKDYRIKTGLPWNDRNIGVSQVVTPSTAGGAPTFSPRGTFAP